MSELFSRLCSQDALMTLHDGESIGTYNEKRFHRIFKRLVTEDAECYEVKIGRYVADVLCDGHITEIQTGSFNKLEPKLRYYLENTDYTVSVVLPLIASKQIVRADKETGEIKYVRRSPRSQGEVEALGHVFYIRKLLKSERLSVHIALVEVEEYRYSEARRYNREGRYDRDIRPVALKREIVLRGAEDYRIFVPDALREGEFDAADFSAAIRLRGRAVYSALNTLCDLGILDRRIEGKKYIWRYLP